jgi:hypothetical protein
MREPSVLVVKDFFSEYPLYPENPKICVPPPEQIRLHNHLQCNPSPLDFSRAEAGFVLGSFQQRSQEMLTISDF